MGYNVAENLKQISNIVKLGHRKPLWKNIKQQQIDR